MEKVNLDVLKPWITKRVTELLSGIEDEVLIGYIFELLESSRVNFFSFLLFLMLKFVSVTIRNMELVVSDESKYVAMLKEVLVYTVIIIIFSTF